MKLVVGLGNPGEKYSKVRHNLGFMVLDKLASSWEYKEKFKSEISGSNANNYTLVKPQTYMNNSGMAVVKLVEYFKVDPSELIVIHDELDLPFGKIKVRLGGAAAGHHGVESIMNALGTDKFIRVRLGIGGAHVDAEKFVLEPFMKGEKSKVKHMIKQAIGALEILLEQGLTVAQNQFN